MLLYYYPILLPFMNITVIRTITFEYKEKN